MACMKLGSKPETFRLDGQTWLCANGLPSDIVIEVGKTSFHLHKFPLLSRSRVLENFIEKFSSQGEENGTEEKNVLQLNNLPGGAKAFLLVAKFCYGVKLELSAMNVVSLRCAAEYLQMTEDFGEGNLIKQTENFLDEVFCNWIDTIKALATCGEFLPLAQELHIVSRCINSLATKACSDPSLFCWAVPGGSSATPSPDCPVKSDSWNGLSSSSKPHPLSDDWWYEDVSFLALPLYKSLIMVFGSRGMKPEIIAGSIIFYAKKYLPLNGRQNRFQNSNGKLNISMPTTSILSDAEQRTLLEELVKLIPNSKGIMTTKFLLKLLRTSIILHASLSCRENLERRIGSQLAEAAPEDLLIPNMEHSAETLYDIDCIQRILDHFMLVFQNVIDSTGCLEEEGKFMEASHSLIPLTMVANLVDSYLAEVAPDVNLKLAKFQLLASAIPDCARHLDDGIYRAIDMYLKAHPWLTDSEKERLCRLMDCQKLSLEASTHAALNERLPLRVTVQILFFEQLRLRTSVAGCFYVSDNIDNSNNPSGSLMLPGNDGTSHPCQGENRIVAVDTMKERVSELEKECLNMRQEIDKLVKNKGSWSTFCKMLGFKQKSSDPKSFKQTNKSKTSRTSSKTLLDAKEISLS